MTRRTCFAISRDSFTYRAKSPASSFVSLRSRFQGSQTRAAGGEGEEEPTARPSAPKPINAPDLRIADAKWVKRLSLFAGYDAIQNAVLSYVVTLAAGDTVSIEVTAADASADLGEYSLYLRPVKVEV